MIARMADTPKTVTMAQPTTAVSDKLEHGVVAAPSPTPEVAEVDKERSADAHGTPLPLKFAEAVKQSVIEAPGASAADTELRVAMRLVGLLKELGFSAGKELSPAEIENQHKRKDGTQSV